MSWKPLFQVFRLVSFLFLLVVSGRRINPFPVVPSWPSTRSSQAVQHMKRCSSSLVIRDMQIKTIMRYYYIPISMAVTHKWGKKNVEDVEKLEPLCITGGNVKWCSHCGKQFGGFSKVKNRITIWPSNFASGHIPKTIESRDSDTCTLMFIAALFTMAKWWKQPRYPSTDERINKMCVYVYCLLKKYSQHRSWELCFIRWEFLGLQAREAASRVTLRELLRGGEGGAWLYRSFATKGR